MAKLMSANLFDSINLNLCYIFKSILILIILILNYEQLAASNTLIPRQNISRRKSTVRYPYWNQETTLNSSVTRTELELH